MRIPEPRAPGVYYAKYSIHVVAKSRQHSHDKLRIDDETIELCMWNPNEQMC